MLKSFLAFVYSTWDKVLSIILTEAVIQRCSEKMCSESMQQIYRRTSMLKWSVISIKLLSNFIEITLRHGCSRVNLLHVSRKPFTKNTYGWLLLTVLLMSTFQVKRQSFLTSINNVDTNCIKIDWLIFECGQLFLVRLNLT